MKDKKLCPKCNTTDILKIEGSAGMYGTGNNIMIIYFIYWSVINSISP